MTMLERLVESRVVASFAVGAAVWIGGRFGAPFPEDHAILQLIRVERPLVYDAIRWANAILWFTTPYLLTSMAMSLAYVFLVKQRPRACGGPLPPYPVPAEREDLYVVLGEVHHPKKPVPLSHPHWLAIPERNPAERQIARHEEGASMEEIFTEQVRAGEPAERV